jgi:hypothetical protein
MLKVQVLLQQRVLGARTRRRLTEQRPVLGPDGLGLELRNLLRQLALSPLVRGLDWMSAP